MWYSLFKYDGVKIYFAIQITPCPEADSRRPCILRKGTNVTIEVDLVPSKFTKL